MPLRPVILAFVPLAPASRADDGQGLYNKACSSCHGADGKGQTEIGLKLGAKDLGASKPTDAEIEKQIREGRAGEDGKLKMPAVTDTFTQQESKAFIASVKGFRKSKPPA